MPDLSSEMLSSRTFVVGMEDSPDGSLKVYVGARHKGIYALVNDPEDQAEIRSAWGAGGHVVVPCPRADQLYRDDVRADKPQTNPSRKPICTCAMGCERGNATSSVIACERHGRRRKAVGA